MRIVTWNVNGLKARIASGFLNFVAEASPTILCLQELKVIRMDNPVLTMPPFPHRIYNLYTTLPAYSGTAIVTQLEPMNICFSCKIPELGAEARVITLEYLKFFLVTVYMPNAEHSLDRLDLRYSWDEAFAEHIHRLTAIKPVIICGDCNTTLTDDDIRATLPRTIAPQFFSETRHNILTLMEECELVDAFRHCHPNETDAYTWWSVRKHKHDENIGWRLDYFLISQSLLPRIHDCGMWTEIYGSDHCPCYLDIDL